MSDPRSALNWFEIPVRDIDRAQRFYEALTGAPLHRETMGEQTLAIFPATDDAVAGCLVHGAGSPAPSADGTTVYLNASPSLDAMLARVEAAGGRVTTPRTEIPGGMGFYAHIADPEGNRVGLHAMA